LLITLDLRKIDSFPNDIIATGFCLNAARCPHHLHETVTFSRRMHRISLGSNLVGNLTDDVGFKVAGALMNPKRIRTCPICQHFFRVIALGKFAFSLLFRYYCDFCTVNFKMLLLVSFERNVNTN
jgi:hypothetical protein